MPETSDDPKKTGGKTAKKSAGKSGGRSGPAEEVRDAAKEGGRESVEDWLAQRLGAFGSDEEEEEEEATTLQTKQSAPPPSPHKARARDVRAGDAPTKDARVDSVSPDDVRTDSVAPVGAIPPVRRPEERSPTPAPSIGSVAAPGAEPPIRSAPPVRPTMRAVVPEPEPVRDPASPDLFGEDEPWPEFEIEPLATEDIEPLRTDEVDPIEAPSVTDEVARDRRSTTPAPDESMWDLLGETGEHTGPLASPAPSEDPTKTPSRASMAPTIPPDSIQVTPGPRVVAPGAPSTPEEPARPRRKRGAFSKWETTDAGRSNRAAPEPDLPQKFDAGPGFDEVFPSATDSIDEILDRPSPEPKTDPTSALLESEEPSEDPGTQWVPPSQAEDKTEIRRAVEPIAKGLAKVPVAKEPVAKDLAAKEPVAKEPEDHENAPTTLNPVVAETSGNMERRFYDPYLESEEDRGLAVPPEVSSAVITWGSVIVGVSMFLLALALFATIVVSYLWV